MRLHLPFQIVVGLLEGLLPPRAVDGVAERAGQRWRVDLPLKQVVLRAAPHGLDRNLFVGQPRQHHQRQPRQQLAQAVDRLQPVGIRERQVQQDHLERLAIQRGAPQTARPLGAISARAGLIQHRLQQGGVAGIVFHQQDVDWFLRCAHFSPGGNFTMLNQNVSMVFTTALRVSKSAGFTI